MRMIDADEIRKKAVPHTRGEHGYNANIRKWAVLVGDIDDAPTIDAVPVVRCKDCKHFIEKGGILEPWCDWHEARLFCGDGFCSDGERKDGGGNG